MGIFNIFKKDKNDNLIKKQEQEMEKRQEIANELNENYQINTNNIVFTDNDKLRIEKKL